VVIVIDLIALQNPFFQPKRCIACTKQVFAMTQSLEKGLGVWLEIYDGRLIRGELLVFLSRQETQRLVQHH
jgi:hypothetical protein